MFSLAKNSCVYETAAGYLNLYGYGSLAVSFDVSITVA